MTSLFGNIWIYNYNFVLFRMLKYPFSNDLIKQIQNEKLIEASTSSTGFRTGSNCKQKELKRGEGLALGENNPITQNEYPSATPIDSAE